MNGFVIPKNIIFYPLDSNGIGGKCLVIYSFIIVFSNIYCDSAIPSPGVSETRALWSWHTSSPPFFRIRRMQMERCRRQRILCKSRHLLKGPEWEEAP